MRKLKYINVRTIGAVIVLFFTVLLTNSCKDILEEDITESTLMINYPSDGFRSSTRNMEFNWEQLDGASSYSIRIVTPDFANMESIVLDTTLNSTSLFYVMPDVGVYEWSIQALNHGYLTDTIWYRSFIVDSVDFTQETVELLTPANLERTGTFDVDFTWRKFPNVDGYRIEIGDPDFNSGFLLQQDVTATSFSYTFDSIGNYEWRVIAFDVNGYESLDDKIYTVNVDTTPIIDIPKPILISPTDGDSVNLGNAWFSWASNNQITQGDSLLIYRDSLATDLVAASVEELMADSLSHFESDSVDLYWTVRSYDQYGNLSPKAEIRKVLYRNL